MADKPHAILGASSSHRWLACPGSIRLSAGMPGTSSVYADEGTADGSGDDPADGTVNSAPDDRQGQPREPGSG